MISLDKMTTLARTLLGFDEAIERKELELKNAKERARTLREETIPSAMQELGLEKLTLSTGQEITIKQDVYASIPKSDKEKAFQWLQDNGFGGLIKLDVNTKFNREDGLAAADLYNELSAKGLVTSLTQNVNTQTLKAFLREQISKGANIPLDLFGARPVWTTKIKS